MNKHLLKLPLQFFGMKSLDVLKQERTVILQKMTDSIKSDDENAFATAFTEFATNMQEQVLQEAKTLVGVTDSAILAQRGVRQLTSDERTYYQKVIEAMKSKTPKQAVTLIDEVLPTTVIDTIFDELTAEHPLLNYIDFRNTGALTEIIMSTSSGVAGWGELCGTIDDELAGAFTVIQLGMNKLSAFIPVCKAMLDIGPEWLDRYVRTVLSEALAVELEAGIVDGDGKDKPIGMTRALTGAVDGVYQRKTETAITKLDPVTIGGILNTISQGSNNKRRAVPNLLMVVNPADYYTKVYPATTIRATNGTYNNDVMPYPIDIVVSAAVPAGKAIFGLANRYFFGLGTSKGGKLEYSDEYKFLEDVRTYLIKLYGNGRPLDGNAFVYADISGLEPSVLQVEVVSD